jgi:hypothetical protein
MVRIEIGSPGDSLDAGLSGVLVAVSLGNLVEFVTLVTGIVWPSRTSMVSVLALTEQHGSATRFRPLRAAAFEVV